MVGMEQNVTQHSGIGRCSTAGIVIHCNPQLLGDSLHRNEERRKQKKRTITLSSSPCSSATTIFGILCNRVDKQVTRLTTFAPKAQPKYTSDFQKLL
jgi:hypothetical protein